MRACVRVCVCVCVFSPSDATVYKKHMLWVFVFFVLFLFSIFCLFRAALAAYVVSQARGLIRAIAGGLCQSYSNARSKPRL